MDLDPSTLSTAARYRLVTGCVVPRFIAWISTISVDGAPNLAPFSYATIASHAPLSLLFVVAGPKPDGAPKDTLRNALPAPDGGTGEFVVHIVPEALAPAMALSAAPLAHGASELELTGLATSPSVRVRPPRITLAPAAFECRTTRVLPVGSARVVIGEVVHVHLDDAVVDERLRVDPDRLKAIGRMAGSSYARTADRLTIDDERFFPGTERVGS